MTKGVILTERDKNLLYDCYQNGVLSFSQVKVRHFGSVSRATTHNRLTRLRDDEFLRSYKVGIVIHHRTPQEIGVAYLPTKKTLEALCRLFPGESFRPMPLGLNTTTLSHDLLLTDVLTALREHFQKGRVLSTMSYTIQGTRVPDGVIIGPTGSHVAVELELSPKSEKRYREIILQYKLSREFARVLYVVANEKVRQKIIPHILGYKPRPELPQPATGKFFFTGVQGLLSAPVAVSISNGAETLSIN